MVPNHCVDMHYHMHWFTPIPVYLPDKPKPKSAPTRPKRSTEESRERVALGKDVEIKLKPKNGYHPQQVNRLQRRTPSLDDVLGQIRGDFNLNELSLLVLAIVGKL